MGGSTGVYGQARSTGGSGFQARVWVFGVSRGVANLLPPLPWNVQDDCFSKDS